MFVVFWVVSPSFENFNNSKKLDIMNFLSNISKNNFFQKISYWVLLTKIKLCQNLKLSQICLGVRNYLIGG